MSDDDLLVRVKHVSKKFCRNLRRSLWYGVQDLGSELVGRQRNHDVLRRDEFWAVEDVSFELRRGECLGLIGHNGAGKTTLLRMLNGLITPDRGRIAMRGRVGALIALGAGFNPILSGRENIYVNAAVLGLTRRETDMRFDEIVDFSGLGSFIDSPVQQYSSGMQVRLGFAVAAHLEPDILLVDEALAVGDLAYVIKCINRIAALRQQGTGVVFVSHNELQVREVAQRCLLLGAGRPLFQGTPEDAFHQYVHVAPDASGVDAGFVLAGPVTLSINEGNSPLVARVGDPWTLAFQCESTSALVDAALEIRFWNASGQLVSTITTKHSPVAFHLPPGRTDVSVRIANMTLGPGRYRIAAGIRREGEVLGWARDLAHLDVAPPLRSWIGNGVAMLDARIDVARGSDADAIPSPIGKKAL